MCDVRQFSSNIAYRVKKKKREANERERKKDRFSLPFFTHFAFLHLLSSRNVLGVAADVVRRKNIDNNQRTIYIVVVIVDITVSRKEKKRRARRKRNKNDCPYFIY